MAKAHAASLSTALAASIVCSPLISACNTQSAPTTPVTGTSAPIATNAPRTISEPYSPTIDPAAFSTIIDNPYLPMVPGSRIIYELHGSKGLQRTTTEVTRDTKKIMGVTAVVVHDVVAMDGKPFEDTSDWYAQDRDGNVWYFGEATKKIDDDGSIDTSGSFEAGVNGALPGIVMPGQPRVGDQYRQEYARGVAEDTGEIADLNGTETTPLTGKKADLLVTRDADLLDRTGPPETKYYAPGIGLVLTVDPDGRDEAVRSEKS